MAKTQANPASHTSIAAETGVGSVHLSVTDGGRALDFYQDVLGLVQVSKSSNEIRLGPVGGRVLVVLHPGATRPVPARSTGLYHLAIVVPSRRELARVIGRVMSYGYPNSPTDHTMTKSDYLWDPDGNGIEVYAETPEDGTWFMSETEFAARASDGSWRSGRDPIDLEKLFAELEPDDRLDDPMPEATKMGHVHLHIRDVDEAVHFYSDLIGFDVMGLSRSFGVAFVSAGGYHHHIGLNTWAGRGAPRPPLEAAGLRHFTIEVPTPGDLAEVGDRLQAGGVAVDGDPAGDLWVEDPSGNRIRITVRTPSPG
ncbi:MAG: VOC family protein [Actinomycetota bacterium]|nr:VOC family protein [Actinomycetota bacterium]